MIPQAIKAGDITLKQARIYIQACREITSMPDGLTCHEVCSRLAALFPDLEQHEGSFVRGGTHHSWLAFKGTNVIMDAYPWASASGPLLITTEGTVNPWRNLYIEAEPAP
jgi:hypothetical protein